MPQTAKPHHLGWREYCQVKKEDMRCNCWLTLCSCVVQKRSSSSWEAGWSTYLRSCHHVGRLWSRHFCGIKTVSEELRAAEGVKVRSSWPVLQGTLPKMKWSRWQVALATDSSQEINTCREATSKWMKNSLCDRGAESSARGRITWPTQVSRTLPARLSFLGPRQKGTVLNFKLDLVFSSSFPLVSSPAPPSVFPPQI